LESSIQFNKSLEKLQLKKVSAVSEFSRLGHEKSLQIFFQKLQTSWNLIDGQAFTTPRKMIGKS
jgi:hypothetical protein